MEKEIRFFYTLENNNDFIIKKENIWIIRTIIIYTISFFNVILLFNKEYKFVYFLLIEIGLIINLFSNNNFILFNFKNIFSIIFSLIYFKYCINGLGFYYLSFNIFFNILSYSKGKNNSIQINKKVTFYNYMLVINWCLLLYFYIFIIANSIKDNNLVFETIISIILFIMNLLKIERYFDTYYLKLISNLMLIILWLNIYTKFNTVNSIMIVIYYMSILTYEIVDYIYTLYFIYKYKNNYILKTV